MKLTCFFKGHDPKVSKDDEVAYCKRCGNKLHQESEVVFSDGPEFMPGGVHSLSTWRSKGESTITYYSLQIICWSIIITGIILMYYATTPPYLFG